jgi:DNA uptake protein ComE-like DNA-binding protein
VAACATAAFAASAADDATVDQDRQTVQVVCGHCHTIDVFLNKPRSWPRWNDVFADMTQRGASGTDEQLTRVTRFFLENLTIVNVNSSPAEELKWVLGIRDDAVEAILARREHQRFANMADLRSIPGVDSEKLEQRKSRILF